MLPQTTVVEALLCSILYCVSGYYLTKYLSFTLLQKAIRSKRIIPFIFQFIACILIVAALLFLFKYIFHCLEKLGYFPVTPLFDYDYYNFQSLVGHLLAGVFYCSFFCGIGFYTAYFNLEKEHMEAQLQMLQAQIAPHFMFNVLNHINVLMKKDVDAASDLLVKYANILRYQLYRGKEEMVPIQQEVQFLKDFIDVERTRWKDKLTLQCIWDMDNENFNIPPLLLITFVENAFKHVPRSASEKGFIHIAFEQRDKMIRLEVENSKSLMKPEGKKQTDSGIGLENIKRRLNILYPKRHSLVINETDAVYAAKLEIML